MGGWVVGSCLFIQLAARSNRLFLLYPPPTHPPTHPPTLSLQLLPLVNIQHTIANSIELAHRACEHSPEDANDIKRYVKK